MYFNYVAGGLCRGHKFVTLSFLPTSNVLVDDSAHVMGGNVDFDY
jgi:hypothetical protein